jgi:hypothetical protein
MRLVTMTAIATVLAGVPACSVMQQPADPAVVKRIVAICTTSGFFKVVNGTIALAYPPAQIPAQILDYGIDQVCTDPERFASDISTVEWLLKNMPRRPLVVGEGRR